MQTLKIFLLFTLATLIFYLPILSNPQSILQRGNDLQEFYWPVFYFVRQEILENHTFPLWNNLFFSGTPLLADPQSPLFYLPNTIFLVLPIDFAFIVSFVLHTLFAGFGAYITARYGFGLSQSTSIFTGLLYMLFPRTAGFLVEGHYGPFALFTWLPFLVLSGIKLVKTPHFGWSVLFAVSLAFLFFTFPTMALFAAILAFLVIFTSGSYFLFKNRSYQTLLFLLAGTFITFGFTAIALLPQIEWLPHTTRLILLNNPDVYPKWTSKIEFIKALYPHLFGQQFINSLDNEKWIAGGIFISWLAFIGFLQLKKLFKFLIAVTALGIVLISLNNASPVYSLLMSFDWYVLGRVSTRIWFVIVPLAAFLAGFGLEKLKLRGLKPSDSSSRTSPAEIRRSNNLIQSNTSLHPSIEILGFREGGLKRTGKRKLAFTLAVLAIGELLIVSWLRFQLPLAPQKQYASAQVFDFLKKDPSLFRVFCVNRCLSQKDVAKYNLETVEGYGTIYQKNYYDQFIQLSQVFWDKYSSVLPPFEIYNTREIQPYSPEIASYNVKYIISPHTLKDKNFEFVQKFDNYLVYKNTITKSRAYFSNGKEAAIIKYSPNYIKIDTSSQNTNQIIVAEVYNPGWKAKLNGSKEVEITETKNKLRQIDIEKDTQFVELYYAPRSYQIGKPVTLLTIFLTIFVYFVFLITKKKGTLRSLRGGLYKYIPSRFLLLLIGLQTKVRRLKKRGEHL